MMSLERIVRRGFKNRPKTTCWTGGLAKIGLIGGACSVVTFRPYPLASRGGGSRGLVSQTRGAAHARRARRRNAVEMTGSRWLRSTPPPLHDRRERPPSPRQSRSSTPSTPVKLGFTAVDEVHRRVQQDRHGHRGSTGDLLTASGGSCVCSHSTSPPALLLTLVVLIGGGRPSGGDALLNAGRP